MSFMRNPGRYAGLLYVLTSIAGFVAMGYVPKHVIVPGNAAATAANLVAFEGLWRLGIAGQLVGGAGFIFVALALYELLCGVNRRQAVMMAALIIASIPVMFVNEVNSIAALWFARGADAVSAFDKPQREAMAMVLVKLHGQGIVVAELFWGLWLFPLAALVYRSGFIPRLLGVWLALAGIAWISLCLTSVLGPQYQDAVYSVAQPAFFGEIAFMLWLLVRGADPATALSATAR